MFAELPIGRVHDGCDPHDPDDHEPRAVRVLRAFGIVGMTVVVVLIAANEPHPGFAGERLVVLLGLAALTAGILVGQPRRILPPGVRLGALLAVTLGALAVMVEQPEGAAVGGLYFAVVVAALRLPRPLAIAILLLAVSGSGVAAELSDSDMDPVGMAVGLFFALVPWLLVLGLVRDLARGREELRASRAAEAAAAAQAERGRLAREMHDVLAHSLSGLALQLEGARLLARDRDTDPAVVDAIERARHLATSGLDEARGAIAALRGDELPGPERLPLLAEAFAAHSDATCELRVHGEPPALSSEARVALYRTAQEALTNVRKHAAARHVDVDLTYADDGATLVVQDHGAGAPVAVGAGAGAGEPGSGYGLTGMRERAELVGGRLTAGPTDDGFRVELWVPA